MSHAKDAKRAKPQATLTEDDYNRLSGLVRSAAHAAPEVVHALEAELDRARVVANGHAPRAALMGREVEYRDDTTGRDHTVRLVFPAEADIAKGNISILTPIGAALIGLKAGDSMDWETPNGEPRRLTVLAVHAARDE